MQKYNYNVSIRTGWEELKGINFKVTGKIYVDDIKEENK